MHTPSSDNRTRYTLDLTREQHRFLKLFALEAEVEASAVLRSLLGELEGDAQLADRISHMAQASSRRGRGLVS